MTSKVVSIKPSNPADDVDTVLEMAKGNYQNVVIIGYDMEGRLDVMSDLGTSHERALFLCQLFSQKLLTGDYSDDAV